MELTENLHILNPAASGDIAVIAGAAFNRNTLILLLNVQYS
jgi:hypothetical protein